MVSLLVVPSSVALALASPIVAQVDRAFHAVAYDSARARTVMFGGWSNSSNSSDTWEFDGDTWTPVTTSPASPSARQAHGLVYDAARARTVLFGGIDGNGSVADTWEYDGNQWQQVATALAPSPRCFFGFAYDSERQRSVLFGGFGSQASLGDTWEYDGTRWTQMQPTTAPSPRIAAKMVFDPARRCTVLFGGITLSSSASVLLGDTWEYAQGQWRLTTPLASPSARYRHAMVYDSSRLCIAMAGGMNSNGDLDDAWEFDGATWHLSATALPSARHGHALAYEPVTGRRVLIGGTYGYGIYDTATWESDGGPWGQVQTRVLAQTVTIPPYWFTLGIGTSPGRRAGVAIAHDSTRHRTVIWGGWDWHQPLADTWEFARNNWSQVVTLHAPPAAGLSPAVFDMARNRTVLLTVGPNNSVQTWEYDGVDWTWHPTATTPSALGLMTYDVARARSVLVLAGETWEYDGVDWLLATSGLPSFYSSALAYDSHRQRTVLVGLSNLSGNPETWEYDGAAWTEVAAPSVPLDVRGACFDVGQNQVVVATYSSGLWGYDGASWVLLTGSPPLGCGLVYDQVLQRPLAFGGVIPDQAAPWQFLDTTQILQPPTPPVPRPATWVRHGAGCSGSGGTPDLGTLGNAIPAMGSTFVWQVSGLPPTNNLALLSFGFGISRYQGHALPLALDQVGLPACQLWIEPQDGLYATLPNSGGLVLYGFRIPNSPALAGQMLSSQAVVLDPLASSGIDSVSNAGIMQIR